MLITLSQLLPLWRGIPASPTQFCAVSFSAQTPAMIQEIICSVLFCSEGLPCPSSLSSIKTDICRGHSQIWSLECPPPLARSGPLNILRFWPDLFPSPQPRRPEQLPIPLSASGIYLTDPNHLVSLRAHLLLFILAWIKNTLLPFPFPFPPLISSPMGRLLGEQEHMGAVGNGVPGQAGSCLLLLRLSWPT